MISMGRVFVSQSLYHHHHHHHHHRCRSISTRNLLSHYNYHAFSTSSISLNLDPFAGCHKSKQQTAVIKKEEPLNYNIGTTTLDATDSWKELEKQNIMYNLRYNNYVKKGDVIDIHNFLFTKYRDYLIRCNDQTQVKAEQLAGKVIVLYFVSLSIYPALENYLTNLLKKIYNDLLQNHHGIEIVLVAIDDGDVTESKKHFEDFFSRMPWTAIPFSDEKCRRFLQKNFSVSDTCMSVVDSTGVVLQTDAYAIIKDYGALGFPFSDEKLELLYADNDASVERPSLMTLLGSPQRDYVITNRGEKVPISTLEEKVVGLYFYDDHSASSAVDIRTVYEEMAKTKENFEVVLIYLADSRSTNVVDEESFWETFETMPWLALPYNDPCTEKLKRIFDYDPLYDVEYVGCQPELVIFGPHGEFIEPFGRYMMYLNPVYPFTFETLAKSEAEKVENLKMEMLWHPDTVLRKNDGSQMRISQLAGKRVLLVFEMEVSYLIGFVMQLKEKYLELKGTDEEFEVIHILDDNILDDNILKNKEMDTMMPIHDLPWFVSLASELLPGLDLGLDLEFCECAVDQALLAFDQDGKLVRRSLCCTFADPDFPFFSGSLEEETLSQLIELQMWDYWNHYAHGQGGIYTFHKKLREQHISDRDYRVWRMINA